MRSQKLGRDGFPEGHVEILFPACQGIVRAPEGQKSGIVVQQEGNGGELGVLLRDQDIPVLQQKCIAEPFRFCRGHQKAQIRLHPAALDCVGLIQKFL